MSDLRSRCCPRSRRSRSTKARLRRPCPSESWLRPYPPTLPTSTEPVVSMSGAVKQTIRRTMKWGLPASVVETLAEQRLARGRLDRVDGDGYRQWARDKLLIIEPEAVTGEPVSIYLF